MQTIMRTMKQTFLLLWSIQGSTPIPKRIRTIKLKVQKLFHSTKQHPESMCAIILVSATTSFSSKIKWTQRFMSKTKEIKTLWSLGTMKAHNSKTYKRMLSISKNIVKKSEGQTQKKYMTNQIHTIIRTKTRTRMRNQDKCQTLRN